MMVSRGALLRLAALAFALLFALPGCVSYDTSGPLFKPAPPADGHGVVYVMRTRSQFGMLQSIKAEVDKERWFTLHPGSYGAFYLPAGKARLTVAVDVWGEVGVFAVGAVTITTASAHADRKERTLEIDVPAGGAVYVDVSIAGFKRPPDAEVVPVDDGRSDIADLHLAPGGRPRLSLATTAIPAASATAPAPIPALPPSASRLAGEVRAATDQFGEACKPRPDIPLTCDGSGEDAKRALESTRSATERLRALPPSRELSASLRAFTTMLEAVEADQRDRQPIPLSRVGALKKTAADLEAASRSIP